MTGIQLEELFEIQIDLSRRGLGALGIGVRERGEEALGSIELFLSKAELVNLKGQTDQPWDTVREILVASRQCGRSVVGHPLPRQDGIVEDDVGQAGDWCTRAIGWERGVDAVGGQCKARSDNLEALDLLVKGLAALRGRKDRLLNLYSVGACPEPGNI
jgi:hypothetical protein